MFIFGMTDRGPKFHCVTEQHQAHAHDLKVKATDFALHPPLFFNF